MVKAQGEISLQHMSIDGGGGSSAGGRFRLGATIGQPAAGQLQGGRFTLIGGFWTPLELGLIDPPDFTLKIPFVKR
jgi:hypothetical protein